MKNKIVHSLLALGLGLSIINPASAEISEKDFTAAMEKFLQTDSGMSKLGEATEKYFQKKQQLAMKDQEAKAKSELEDQFKNPVKIDVGSSPVKGNASAKVTVIEFSDFQCPYCKRGHDTMDELLAAYPNDVKLVFKHYPLPFHKQAEPAARAAWAAQQQGKFWEFHDALFKTQEKLNDAASAEQLFNDTAKTLGLDLTKFKADMSSEAAAKAVKTEAEQGAKNGIQGTPGFFVNGVAVKGAYPVSHFKEIVERWLKGAPVKK